MAPSSERNFSNLNVVLAKTGGGGEGGGGLQPQPQLRPSLISPAPPSLCGLKLKLKVRPFYINFL